MLKWIVESPDFDKYDLSSLKVITYGAAPMPFEVIKKAIERMPRVQFINGYGQTESASTLTTLGPEDHRIVGTDEEKQRKWWRLQSSIGRPLSDVEIRIVNDEGNILPAMAVGDIQAKGPRIMRGYWEDEGKTLQALTTDGWLRTGDLGYVDEEGYVYLAGRADDLIIRGGENIAPAEIEEVLSLHPKVEDSAVIAVPDAEFGQQPFAYCVLRKGQTSTAEEIIEFCRNRLSSFKCPKGVVFLEELPRNPVGKLLRKELRDSYDKS
jgi:acyl-CoA synthetase (AMP-forming)/AMP-acid ligase II